MNGYTFERRELKYRITDAQRAALEAAFGTRMVPDEHGESTICNIYYITIRPITGSSAPRSKSRRTRKSCGCAATA